MIVRLTVTNDLPAPIEIRSNMASNQPLQPHEALQMTLELHEGADGVAEVQLACAPLEPS